MPYTNESAWQADWPVSDTKSRIGVRPFAPLGHDFPGGVKAGDVAWLFTDLCVFLHSLEPMQAPGCWGWSYRPNRNNSRRPSRHGAGIGIDYNAPRHPNGKAGTWSATKKAKINARLRDRYKGVIRWGENYRTTVDGMHFEINGTPAEIAALVRSLRGSRPKARYTAVKGDTVDKVVAKFKPRWPRLDRDTFLLCNGYATDAKIYDLLPGRSYRVEP